MSSIDVNVSTTPAISLEDLPRLALTAMAEAAKRYRVVVIGAGVGGLLTMYKILRALPHNRFELRCYEKYVGRRVHPGGNADA